MTKNFTGRTARKRVLDASDGSCLFYVQITQFENGGAYDHLNMAVATEKDADKLVEALTTLAIDIVKGE